MATQKKAQVKFIPKVEEEMNIPDNVQAEWIYGTDIAKVLQCAEELNIPKCWLPYEYSGIKQCFANLKPDIFKDFLICVGIETETDEGNDVGTQPTALDKFNKFSKDNKKTLIAVGILTAIIIGYLLYNKYK